MNKIFLSQYHKFLLDSMPQVHSKLTRSYIRKFCGDPRLPGDVIHYKQEAEGLLKSLELNGFCTAVELLSKDGKKVIKRTWQRI